MKVLVAGAGGVLGQELVSVLHRKGMAVAGLGYREGEFNPIRDKLIKALCGDVTRPASLKGMCEGIDIVLSCIGITRISTRLNHMDVDYQGNLNLLKEAKKSRVKKFAFISPAGVDKGYGYVPLFKAKYLFEEELKKSGLDWLIFRSGGFFKDLAEMTSLAEKGPIFIVGRGKHKFTPIDVKELAEIMVEDSLKINNQIIEVGGPQDLSWREICHCCFTSINKKTRLLFLPVWLCKFLLWSIRPFSYKYFALGRLLIFTSTMDLPTSKRGRISFSEYLNSPGG